MSKDRDILKTLLLKEELEQLEKLNHKLLSEDQFTKEVANVLSAATHRARKKNNELDVALSQPIRNGVNRAFGENKQLIIDSLLPIMGQLIRKTVSNSIKQFVTDINRTLELGFSTKAIKWRYQAYKAGVTFAEIVFQKTIRYQVKDLFLINRNNGLLIEHVGAGELLKDKNAISGMLTAIQDFIGDSLQTPNADLLSAEVGDSIILISTGPNAYLASVIKGSPTTRLKIKSQKLIEKIHAEFSSSLSNENLYRNNPDLGDRLRANLITKSISEDNKRTNWLPWILALVILIVGTTYWSYKRQQQYNKVVDIAQSIDGLYLQSVKRIKSGYQVTGLLDPIADISPLQNHNIQLDTKSFISLDNKILNKRIEQIISKYNGVEFKLIDSEIHLTGTINSKNNIILLNQLEIINGIDKTTSQLEIIYPKQIPPKPKKTLINSSLLKLINQTIIYLPQHEIQKVELLRLNNVIKSLHSIIKSGIKIRIVLTGMSDCEGTKSDQYSLKRANLIKKMLIDNGINGDIIKTDIKPCQNYFNKTDVGLLYVHINIKQL